MIIEVKIPNLKKLQAAMKQAPRSVIKYTDEAIKRSIMDISGVARSIAPIKTSFLKSSIGKGIGWKTLEGWIKPTADYAIFVHEGTRKWPISKRSKTGERRFLTVAAKRKERDIEKYFEEALENVANDIARKAK